MGKGVCCSIFDTKTGKPAVLSCGSWFCYECNKLRKTIDHPFTGTITEPCKKCGSKIVYKME